MIVVGSAASSLSSSSSLSSGAFAVNTGSTNPNGLVCMFVGSFAGCFRRSAAIHCATFRQDSCLVVFLSFCGESTFVPVSLASATVSFFGASLSEDSPGSQPCTSGAQNQTATTKRVPRMAAFLGLRFSSATSCLPMAVVFTILTSGARYSGAIQVPALPLSVSGIVILIRNLGITRKNCQSYLTLQGFAIFTRRFHTQVSDPDGLRHFLYFSDELEDLCERTGAC